MPERCGERELIEPERALWAGVLEQALFDLAGGRGPNRRTDANRASLRREALQWICSRETSIGSFVWCCDQISLDSTAVQQRVLRADQQQRLAGRPEPVLLFEPAEIKKNKKVRAKMSKTNGNGLAHVQWLKDQLTQYEKRLVTAQGEVQRLRPVVANLRGTIEVLSHGGGAGSRNQNGSAVPKRDAAGRFLNTQAQAHQSNEAENPAEQMVGIRIGARSLILGQLWKDFFRSFSPTLPRSSSGPLGGYRYNRGPGPRIAGRPPPFRRSFGVR